MAETLPVAAGVTVNTQPQGNSLLDTAGKLMGIQQQANQNRLFQQEYQSRVELGPLLQQAVNQDPNSPNFGQLDVDKFSAMASQNPAVSWRMMEVVKGALANRQTQIDNAAKQLEQDATRLKLLNTNLAGLAALGDSLTPKHVTDAATKLVANGVMSPQKAAVALSDMPQEGGKALHDWIKTRALTAAGAEKALDLQFGEVKVIQAGNQDLLVQINKVLGVPTQIGSVTKTMTPSESAERVTGPVGPGGAPTTISKGESAEASGLAAPGTYTGGANRAAPGPMPTALAPAQAKYEEGVGTKSSEYISELKDRVKIGQDLMVRLEEMRDTMKEIRTGGGSQAWLQLAKLAQAFGASDELVDAISGGNTGSAEEFNKFALQSSVELLRQMLVGSRMTNLEFEQFQKNNPNLDTDPRATEKIFNFVSRMYKLSSDELQEFDKFAKEGGVPKDWAAEWDKRLRKSGRVKVEETGQTTPRGSIAKSTTERGEVGGKYKTTDEVAAAYRKGDLTYDAAAKILREQFGVK